MNRRGAQRAPKHASARAARGSESRVGGIIAEVRPDPAKPGCIAVRIRGRKPWRIDHESAETLGIAAGVTVDSDLLTRLDQAAANCAARLKLQGRLAVRPLSKAEAMSRLRRAGADGAYAAAVIARFMSLGWLDDARLAESVAAAEAARPVGRMRVVARVARRGIGAGDARKAADAAVASRRESQSELAEIAARSQLRKLPPGLDPETRWRRLLGFLARRGFDEFTARGAIDAVLGRNGQRAPD